MPVVKGEIVIDVGINFYYLSLGFDAIFWFKKAKYV